MTRILILGAGTAGTIMANRLRRLYARDVAAGLTRITVVGESALHVYQPGLLFLPFGGNRADQLLKPTKRQLHRQIEHLVASVDHVDYAANLVRLTSGTEIPYDVLIIATGTRLAPDETEGLTGPGWREKIFDFYTLEGATALQSALAAFNGGKLVINIVDMPIKCPVAPLEFAFLADAYFTKRGIRDTVDISFVTPLDGAFTKPVCTAELTHILDEKRINLITEFNAGRVDGVAGKLYSWDEREVPFDLLVTVPLHLGAAFVSRSPGLGDDSGFVRVDQNTLQSRVAPNVFAIGDATDVPTSKAGSVAHFEAEVLSESVRRFLEGKPLVARFDGHANCFIETGFDRALLIDFNYEVEPLPGSFPLPVLGPMRLMKQTRLNHLGKLAFRWIYWHMLLPGRGIPGITTHMSMRGKHRPPSTPQVKPPAAPEPILVEQEEPAGSAV